MKEVAQSLEGDNLWYKTLITNIYLKLKEKLIKVLRRNPFVFETFFLCELQP